MMICVFNLVSESKSYLFLNRPERIYSDYDEWFPVMLKKCEPNTSRQYLFREI